MLALLVFVLFVITTPSKPVGESTVSRYYRLLLPAALSPSAGSQQALQQDREPAHWESVPDDISLAVTMPPWAGCPRPPCKYGQMADGGVNASVSSRPPTARQGISGGQPMHVLYPRVRLGCGPF